MSLEIKSWVLDSWDFISEIFFHRTFFGGYRTIQWYNCKKALILENLKKGRKKYLQQITVVISLIVPFTKKNCGLFKKIYYYQYWFNISLYLFFNADWSFYINSFWSSSILQINLKGVPHDIRSSMGLNYDFRD